LKIFKNLAGAALLVAGVVMIFLPGSGALTIVLGLLLVDFPGKYDVLRKLLCRPKVSRAVNKLRQKFGRRPLVLECPVQSPQMNLRRERSA
jgi:hypothetical protein